MTQTWKCGFCDADVPFDADDQSHVGGACAGVPQDQTDDGIPIDVETANELIRQKVIRGP